MKHLLLITGICLCCFQLKAGDTTYYESGAVSTIRKSHSSYTNFYENGNIRSSIQEMSLFRLGRRREYDSTGVLAAKGKTFHTKEHRNWHYYRNGQLIETKRFRYGILKDSLRNSAGKKVDCIIGYGKMMRNASCESSKDQYKVIRVTVAGCMVNRALVIRADLHNLRIECRKSIRYGFNWQEEMEDLCREEHQQLPNSTSP